MVINNNKNKLLTIIIPCYNGQKYLKRCISSLDGLRDEISILFINDGSTDLSEQIIGEYVQVNKNARLINKNNGGYSSAINCGLDHCESTYVMFLGVDDEIISSGINSICEYLQLNTPDILAFTTIKVFDDGNDYFCKKEKDSLTDYRENGCYETDIASLYQEIKNDAWILFTRDTSRCFKMDTIKNLRYFGKMGVAADGCFSSLVACRSKVFGFLNKECYLWHLHSDSVSAKPKNVKRLIDEANVWEEYFAFFEREYKYLKIPDPIFNQLFAYRRVVNKLSQFDDNEITKKHRKKLAYLVKWFIKNKSLSFKSYVKLYLLNLFYFNVK